MTCKICGLPLPADSVRFRREMHSHCRYQRDRLNSDLPCRAKGYPRYLFDDEANKASDCREVFVSFGIRHKDGIRRRV